MAPSKHKVRLTGVPETLLMTLRAKALDARARPSVLGDTLAVEWVDSLDYDFDKLAGFGDALIAVRAAQLDAWARDFLKAHPQATVLNLGCGLDTRYFRIKPGPGVLWFDIDLPEVMDIRQRLCGEQPGYRMITASVTDPGLLPDLPYDRTENVPVLVIAEGLLEYLTEDEVKGLINRITGRFGAGEMVFDVMNSFAIQAASKNLKAATGGEGQGARHRWAVDRFADVEKLDPRLKRVQGFPLFASRFARKAPLKSRMVYTLLRFLPPFRTMLQMLRYRF